MMHLTDRIVEGKATPADVELLRDVASQIKGKCLCALGEFRLKPSYRVSTASVQTSTLLSK